jgi:hypothetical protein
MKRVPLGSGAAAGLGAQAAARMKAARMTDRMRGEFFFKLYLRTKGDSAGLILPEGFRPVSR